MNSLPLWISCGVLQKELENLLHTGLIQGHLFIMKSMLHMDPQHLEKCLLAKLDSLKGVTSKIIVVYGDCCPGMINLVPEYSVVRVNAINCAQMLLGRDHYKDLMRQQSFVMLPEWSCRWHEIFNQELGLNEEVAKQLLGENRKQIVYLDTGVIPVPHKELEACSQYTGLPLHIENTSLNHLLNYLHEAEARA